MRGDMPNKVVRRARSGEVPAWSVSLRGDIHITVTRGGLSDTPEGCPEIKYICFSIMERVKVRRLQEHNTNHEEKGANASCLAVSTARTKIDAKNIVRGPPIVVLWWALEWALLLFLGRRSHAHIHRAPTCTEGTPGALNNIITATAVSQQHDPRDSKVSSDVK